MKIRGYVFGETNGVEFFAFQHIVRLVKISVVLAVVERSLRETSSIIHLLNSLTEQQTFAFERHTSPSAGDLLISCSPRTYFIITV